MPNFHLLLLFLALASAVVTAQTAVEGALRDNTGKSVQGANITLKRAEGRVAYEISDSEGKFRFGAVDAGPTADLASGVMLWNPEPNA